MRVWIDMTASAHVLVFRPLIELMRKRGDQVEITARDYAQTLQLLELHGLSAEVIGPAEVPALLPMLAEVSDAWLNGRHAREKGFSVAAFDPDYLAAQCVILLRQNGRPVAFATFMTTDLHTEATVGVMRHAAATSPYAMEFVFTRLALNLKQAGFSRLSLGMAPLSGLANLLHRLPRVVRCVTNPVFRP